MLQQYYSKVYQTVVQFLHDNADDFSLSTDIWTSVSKEGYVAMNVSFITQDWIFHQICLDIKHITGSHSGENITIHLDESFEKMNSMPFSTVSDNASNFVVAFKNFNTIHIRCSIHTLQLTVIKALEPIQELLQSCHSLVTHFSHSIQAHEKLINVQKNIRKL